MWIDEFAELFGQRSDDVDPTTRSDEQAECRKKRLRESPILEC